jgi:hypothetical protein
MISGFLEEGGVFLLLAGCPPSLLSFFLSRQFTIKYFNNYFPTKGEIALHEIFMI